MIRWNLLVVGLMVVGALVSGCSKGPELAAVKGIVMLDDKPLPKGTITFESPGKRPATAQIENGQIINPETYKLGDGIPVGSHKVAISSTDGDAPAVVDNPGAAKAPNPNYMSGKSAILPKYNNPDTSGLTAEIKPGVNNLEFKLSSKEK